MHVQLQLAMHGAMLSCSMGAMHNTLACAATYLCAGKHPVKASLRSPAAMHGYVPLIMKMGLVSPEGALCTDRPLEVTPAAVTQPCPEVESGTPAAACNLWLSGPLTEQLTGCPLHEANSHAPHQLSGM